MRKRKGEVHLIGLGLRYAQHAPKKRHWAPLRPRPIRAIHEVPGGLFKRYNGHFSAGVNTRTPVVLLITVSAPSLSIRICLAVESYPYLKRYR
jgi:hypothetical protein